MTTETQAPESTTADATLLLTSMRKGDPASCRAFIAHFQAPLYNYLYWLTGDPDSAVALFQGTMLAVYRNLGRVRRSRNANLWVYRQATQLYLEQGRRQLQKKRSSWDNILKGGLPAKPDEKWSQWDDSPSDVAQQPTTRMPFLVDALKLLAPRERAAILLAALPGHSPRNIVACLQLTGRATARILLKAYGQLALSLQENPGAEPSAAPKGARAQLRSQQLGLLSPAREKKLANAIDTDEAIRTLHQEEEAVWQAIQSLPTLAAPEDLLGRTEAHLRAGQEAQEARIATWGFRFMQVTVPVFIVIFITIILLPTISSTREAAQRAAASQNLQAIGEALLAYSSQSSGNYLPPLVNERNSWAPDLIQLYPRYIQDPALLVRPSLKDPALVKAMTDALKQSPPDYATAQRLFARSYIYTGYVLQSRGDLETLNAARKTIENLDPTRKIETPSKDFYRLGKGVEIFFTTNYNDPEAAAKTRATIPVMFETFDSPGFGGDPDGANVLYLDGHVDYVRFGEAFPVNAGVQELLEEER